MSKIKIIEVEQSCDNCKYFGWRRECIDCIEYCNWKWDGKNDDVERVDTVPVVHGYWIDIDTETYTWKIRCSRCGHERSMMSTGKTYPMYCENCGARMDGKDCEHDKG